MIDQDVAHYLRANSKEVCAIVPLKLLLTDKFEIRLIYKRCCLQSVARAFLTYLATRDLTQLSMY